MASSQRTAILLKDVAARPLTFLYPRSARRFLHASSPNQQGSPGYTNELKVLLGSLAETTHVPSTETSSVFTAILKARVPTMPPPPPPPHQTESSPTPITPTGIPQVSPYNSMDFIGNLNRKKAAMTALTDMNDILDRLGSSREQREALQREYEDADKINSEIYRFTAPIATGTYVSPKDFSFEEYSKWQSRWRKGMVQRRDLFKMLKVDPIVFYKNFNLLKDFQTSHGRIKHRSVTGLSNVHQRKVAKAIRRAVGIGLLPSVHRHPVVLAQEQIFEKQQMY